ncbi:MAG: hypothetical protein RL071_3841 [Pseudomonadota bacterium]
MPSPRPREHVLYDEPEPCPYLPGRMARMPLRLQLRPLQPAAFDELLAQGDRRVGQMLYRTACGSCAACEPLRLPVAAFAPTRSQRRALQKNRDVVVEAGPATYTAEKLALYNRHKRERGLSHSDEPMTRSSYEGWFLSTCVTTVEMRYLVDGRLIGVGILDLGEQDASSVYFYFDPDEAPRSLGVFSALMELAWLRSRGGRYLYMGLWVEDCRHLYYKAGYAPHERRIGGEWQRFDAPAPARRFPGGDEDDAPEAPDAPAGPDAPPGPSSG